MPALDLHAAHIVVAIRDGDVLGDVARVQDVTTGRRHLKI